MDGAVRLGCVLPIVALAVVHGGQAPAPQTPTFRGTANAVPIYATVTDAEGRVVQGLMREEFEILDGGKPREITVFAATHQPITAALLLDMNGPDVEVPWLRAAAEGFVGALGDGDRIRLGTFGDEVFFSPRLTGDQAYLRWVLAEELWSSYASPLWNALDAAIDVLPREAERRDIVVLTNGYDLPPRRLAKGWNQRRVIPRAEAAGVIVHAVTFESVTVDRGIRELATRTGGTFTQVRDLSQVPDLFARLVEELHSQYLLGFVPAALDGKAHDVLVRTTRPGLHVRARTRYVAGAAR